MVSQSMEDWDVDLPGSAETATAPMTPKLAQHGHDWLKPSLTRHAVHSHEWMKSTLSTTAKGRSMGCGAMRQCPAMPASGSHDDSRYFVAAALAAVKESSKASQGELMEVMLTLNAWRPRAVEATTATMATAAAATMAGVAATPAITAAADTIAAVDCQCDLPAPALLSSMVLVTALPSSPQ